MAVSKVFVHGVPDSPAVWRPLIEILGLEAENTLVPNLPGFSEAAPKSFKSTKDEYADWLIGLIEERVEKTGPVDLVGHDWGALLTLRVASLRPDLIASWAVSNAVIDDQYVGHRTARAWNTPILGEIVMGAIAMVGLEKSLMEQGVPADVAREENDQWKRGFASKSILRLYRSADGLRFSGPWVKDLARLPSNGLLIWGENDPYVDLSVGERFSANHQTPIKVINNAGHWAIAERPQDVAEALSSFWSEKEG